MDSSRFIKIKATDGMAYALNSVIHDNRKMIA